jgi:hypothetical protein
MQVPSPSALRDAGADSTPHSGTTVAVLDPNFIETVFDRIRAGGTA